MDWREARLGGSVGLGWEPIIDEMYAKIIALDPDIRVDQVKEKFGGLRFYYHSPIQSAAWKKYSEEDPWNREFTPEQRDAWHAAHNSVSPIEGLVDEACLKCDCICEACGKPGQKTSGVHGWMKTFCPEHTEIYLTGKPVYQVVEEAKNEQQR